MARDDRPENEISLDGGKTWQPCPGCPDCETSDG